MKKVIAVLFISALLAGNGYCSLEWLSGNMVSGGIPDIGAGSAGWLVQMFSDENNDTQLSSVSFFQDGSPSGVANSSDDLLLGSYATSLQYDSRSGSVYFSEIFANYTDLYSKNVYSVVVDNTAWSTVTKTFVLDSATHSFSGSGEEVYSAPADNPGSHSWQNIAAVPEPTTLAFLAIGLGAFVLRRRMR